MDDHAATPQPAEAAAPAARLTPRLADALRALRRARGWSLEQLAAASGVSRATLSRIENAEVSPTAEALAKLCAAFDIALTRLMAEVEPAFPAVSRRDAQRTWRDADGAVTRRAVSPPAGALGAEILACEIAAGGAVRADAPAAPGREHHLLLLDGDLTAVVDGATHTLHPGDCLRYRLHGASRLETVGGARYLLVVL